MHGQIVKIFDGLYSLFYSYCSFLVATAELPKVFIAVAKLSVKIDKPSHMQSYIPLW